MLATGHIAATTTNVPTGLASGSDFIARINIGEVSNLNATQYDVSFDPSVLHLNDVTDRLLGSTTIGAMSNELVPGTWWIVQFLGLETVSGSSFLSELHFHVTGSPGQSCDISLSGGILSSMQGEIPDTGP